MLQDVQIREYTLRLFVGNVERELQRKDNRTWTPAQRLYVPCFPTTDTHRQLYVCRDVSPTSEIRAEFHIKRGHLVWTKHRQADEVVDLQDLFNDYWASKNHKFVVPSQSCHQLARSYLIKKCSGRCRWKAPFVSRDTIPCKCYCSSL